MSYPIFDSGAKVQSEGVLNLKLDTGLLAYPSFGDDNKQPAFLPPSKPSYLSATPNTNLQQNYQYP